MNDIPWYQKHDVHVVTGIQFKTSLFKVLLTVTLVLVFILLGLWQLNRAQEKTQIRDQFLAQAQLPTLTVGADLLDADSMVFRNAIAHGQYVENYQILLDNKVYRGQAGYHVLTPLLLSGSGTLLIVNRGWVPWGPDRQQLPHINTPQHETTIHGRLSKPEQYAISFDSHLKDDEFQQVWQNLDLEKFERLTGYPVHALVIQLDADEDKDPKFVREWPLYGDSWIQRHWAYAMQWFGLASIIVFIFLFFSLRRKF